MTGLPAATICLADRGIIGTAMKADLVIMGLTDVMNRSDYADPHRYPGGLSRVMVERIREVVEEKLTGEYTGRLLLKKPS
jgi:N-acyl-D-aspartate/D-glutamate deacylase